MPKRTAEIKRNLIPERAGGGQPFIPATDLAKLFSLQADPKELSIRFFDGDGDKLRRDGLSLRLRGSEVTLKRRFVFAEDAFDQVVDQAEAKGYKQDLFKFEFEIGSNSSHRVLTCALEFEPTEIDSNVIVTETIAQVQKVHGDLAEFLTQIQEWRILGPFNARKWTGAHDAFAEKLSLEIWDLPGSRILECSTKIKPFQLEAAEAAGTALDKLIQTTDWLSPTDLLKTDLAYRAFPLIPLPS